jgi:hypothetical protein
MAMYGAGTSSVQRKALEPSWKQNTDTPLNWSQDSSAQPAAESYSDAPAELSFAEAYPDIDTTVERVVRPTFGSPARPAAPSSGAGPTVQRDMAAPPAITGAAPAPEAGAAPEKPKPMDRSQFLAFLWQKREEQLNNSREQIQRNMDAQAEYAEQHPELPARTIGKRRRGAVVDVPVQRSEDDFDGGDAPDSFFLNDKPAASASPSPVQLSRESGPAATPSETNVSPAEQPDTPAPTSSFSGTPSIQMTRDDESFDAPAMPDFADSFGSLPDSAFNTSTPSLQPSRDSAPDAPYSADDAAAYESPSSSYNAPTAASLPRATGTPAIQPKRDADTPVSSAASDAMPSLQRDMSDNNAPFSEPQMPTEAYMSPGSTDATSAPTPGRSGTPRIQTKREGSSTPTTSPTSSPEASSGTPTTAIQPTRASSPADQAFGSAFESVSSDQPGAPAIQPMRETPASSMMYMPMETVLRDTSGPSAANTAAPGIQADRDDALPAADYIPTESFMSPRESQASDFGAAPASGSGTPATGSVQRKADASSSGQTPNAPSAPSNASATGSVQRKADASSGQTPNAPSAPSNAPAAGTVQRKADASSSGQTPNPPSAPSSAPATGSVQRKADASSSGQTSNAPTPDGMSYSPDIQPERDDAMPTAQIPTEAFMSQPPAGPTDVSSAFSPQAPSAPGVQRKVDASTGAPASPLSPQAASTANVQRETDVWSDTPSSTFSPQTPSTPGVQRKADPAPGTPASASNATQSVTGSQPDYPMEAPTLLEPPTDLTPSSSFNTYDAGTPVVQRKAFSDSVPPSEPIPAWSPSPELAPAPLPHYADPSPWLGFVPGDAPASNTSSPTTPPSAPTKAPRGVQRKKTPGITEFSETVSSPKQNVESPPPARLSAPSQIVQRAAEPDPAPDSGYDDAAAPPMDVFQAMMAAGMVSGPSNEAPSFSSPSQSVPGISRSISPNQASNAPASGPTADASDAAVPAAGSVEADLLRLINMPANTPVTGLGALTGSGSPPPIQPSRQAPGIQRAVQPGPQQSAVGNSPANANADASENRVESPYTPSTFQGSSQQTSGQGPAPSSEQRAPSLPPVGLTPPTPPVQSNASQQGNVSESAPIQRAITLDEMSVALGGQEGQAGQEGGAGEPDVERLARTVFGMLRDKLRSENERRGR